MSYGWLTESTLFGKKEKVIELGKDKLFNESKDNKKSENSIDQLNGIVNSYLQNLSYEDKLYSAKNDGVEKRNKQDRKDLSVKKQINKVKKYEQLQKAGRNDPKCLVDFESKKQMESELEEIRKLKAQRNGQKYAQSWGGNYTIVVDQNGTSLREMDDLLRVPAVRAKHYFLWPLLMMVIRFRPFGLFPPPSGV